MNTQSSNLLKINKLSKAQFDRESDAGNLDPTALYFTPEEAITFNNSGNGAVSGTTFDGSVARTISHNTIGAAPEVHTHGNITNDGKLGTASKAVITDSNKNITTGTVPVGSGGTGQTSRVDAMNALFSLGSNPITSTTNDTVTNWGAYGPGLANYSTDGQLTDQPQRYGIVVNFPYNKSGELWQLWHSQPTGALYHRGGNPTGGWNSTTWRELLDTSNYTTYLVPKTGGTFKGEITATAYTATSDKRLKENIDSYVCNKSILDLDVKKFDFINGEKSQIGCIAQDLLEICPELVKEGEDGYLRIHESKLVYLLLQELKKQNKRLAELEAKL